MCDKRTKRKCLLCPTIIEYTMSDACADCNQKLSKERNHRITNKWSDITLQAQISQLNLVGYVTRLRREAILKLNTR